MNIWFFIILLVALALVLGPISMLKPKPVQKRKENLRLHASQKGIRFTLRRPPMLSTDTEQAQLMPVYYLPPIAKGQSENEWILMRTHYVHEGNFHQEWDWQTKVRPSDGVCEYLKEYLPQLPASVIAISQGNLGTCVFWSEKEDKEMLELLIEMINRLHQQQVIQINGIS